MKKEYKAQFIEIFPVESHNIIYQCFHPCYTPLSEIRASQPPKIIQQATFDYVIRLEELVSPGRVKAASVHNDQEDQEVPINFSIQQKYDEESQNGDRPLVSESGEVKSIENRHWNLNYTSSPSSDLRMSGVSLKSAITEQKDDIETSTIYQSVEDGSSRYRLSIWRVDPLGETEFSKFLIIATQTIAVQGKMISVIGNKFHFSTDGKLIFLSLKCPQDYQVLTFDSHTLSQKISFRVSNTLQSTSMISNPVVFKNKEGNSSTYQLYLENKQFGFIFQEDGKFNKFNKLLQDQRNLKSLLFNIDGSDDTVLMLFSSPLQTNYCTLDSYLCKQSNFLSSISQSEELLKEKSSFVHSLKIQFKDLKSPASVQFVRAFVTRDSHHGLFIELKDDQENYLYYISKMGYSQSTDMSATRTLQGKFTFPKNPSLMNEVPIKFQVEHKVYVIQETEVTKHAAGHSNNHIIDMPALINKSFLIKGQNEHQTEHVDNEGFASHDFNIHSTNCSSLSFKRDGMFMKSEVKFFYKGSTKQQHTKAPDIIIDFVCPILFPLKNIMIDGQKHYRHQVFLFLARSNTDKSHLSIKCLVLPSYGDSENFKHKVVNLPGAINLRDYQGKDIIRAYFLDFKKKLFIALQIKTRITLFDVFSGNSLWKLELHQANIPLVSTMLSSIVNEFDEGVYSFFSIESDEKKGKIRINLIEINSDGQKSINEILELPGGGVDQSTMKGAANKGKISQAERILSFNTSPSDDSILLILDNQLITRKYKFTENLMRLDLMNEYETCDQALKLWKQCTEKQSVIATESAVYFKHLNFLNIQRHGHLKDSYHKFELFRGNNLCIDQFKEHSDLIQGPILSSDGSKILYYYVPSSLEQTERETTLQRKFTRRAGFSSQVRAGTMKYVNDNIPQKLDLKIMIMPLLQSKSHRVMQDDDYTGDRVEFTTFTSHDDILIKLNDNYGFIAFDKYFHKIPVDNSTLLKFQDLKVIQIQHLSNGSLGLLLEYNKTNKIMILHVSLQEQKSSRRYIIKIAMPLTPKFPDIYGFQGGNSLYQKCKIDQAGVLYTIIIDTKKLKTLEPIEVNKNKSKLIELIDNEKRVLVVMKDNKELIPMTQAIVQILTFQDATKKQDKSIKPPPLQKTLQRPSIIGASQPFSINEENKNDDELEFLQAPLIRNNTSIYRSRQKDLINDYDFEVLDAEIENQQKRQYFIFKNKLDLHFLDIAKNIAQTKKKEKAGSQIMSKIDLKLQEGFISQMLPVNRSSEIQFVFVSRLNLSHYIFVWDLVKNHEVHLMIFNISVSNPFIHIFKGTSLRKNYYFPIASDHIYDLRFSFPTNFQSGKEAWLGASQQLIEKYDFNRFQQDPNSYKNYVKDIIGVCGEYKVSSESKSILGIWGDQKSVVQMNHSYNELEYVRYLIKMEEAQEVSFTLKEDLILDLLRIQLKEENTIVHLFATKEYFLRSFLKEIKSKLKDSEDALNFIYYVLLPNSDYTQNGRRPLSIALKKRSGVKCLDIMIKMLLLDENQDYMRYIKSYLQTLLSQESKYVFKLLDQNCYKLIQRQEAYSKKITQYLKKVTQYQSQDNLALNSVEGNTVKKGNHKVRPRSDSNNFNLFEGITKQLAIFQPLQDEDYEIHQIDTSEQQQRDTQYNSDKPNDDEISEYEGIPERFNADQTQAEQSIIDSRIINQKKRHEGIINYYAFDFDGYLVGERADNFVKFLSELDTASDIFGLKLVQVYLHYQWTLYSHHYYRIIFVYLAQMISLFIYISYSDNLLSCTQAWYTIDHEPKTNTTANTTAPAYCPAHTLGNDTTKDFANLMSRFYLFWYIFGLYLALSVWLLIFEAWKCTKIKKISQYLLTSFNFFQVMHPIVDIINIVEYSFYKQDVSKGNFFMTFFSLLAFCIDMIMFLMIFVFIYKIKDLSFVKYYLSRLKLLAIDASRLIIVFIIVILTMIYSYKQLESKMNDLFDDPDLFGFNLSNILQNVQWVIYYTIIAVCVGIIGGTMFFIIAAINDSYRKISSELKHERYKGIAQVLHENSFLFNRSTTFKDSRYIVRADMERRVKMSVLSKANDQNALNFDKIKKVEPLLTISAMQSLLKRSKQTESSENTKMMLALIGQQQDGQDLQINDIKNYMSQMREDIRDIKHDKQTDADRNTSVYTISDSAKPKRRTHTGNKVPDYDFDN